MPGVIEDRSSGWGGDDTGPEARRVQAAVFRRMSVRRRLALVDQLYELTTSMALADLRRRSPGATDAQLRQAFVERLRRAAPHGEAEQA